MRGHFLRAAAHQRIDPLWQLAGSAPAVDFNFSSGSMLDKVSGSDLITYTRPSTAWGWNGSQFVEFANNVPRIVVDPETGLRGLLVEEARTNLLLNSDTLSTQTVTVSASPRTLSFYGTGTVTLSGASTAGPLVGTGAAPSRVSLTFTPTAGSLTLTVSGSVRFAMLELGDFPTSPIITTGSALTRSADVAVVTGANFSSWYPGAPFSPYVAGVAGPIATNAFPRTLQVSGTTSGDRVSLQRYNANGNSRIAVVTGGVNQSAGDSGSTAAGSELKQAAAIVVDDFAFQANGGNLFTDNSGSVPVVDRMSIGSAAVGSYCNNIISRLTVWPTRLPNATLQALTA